MLEPSSTNSVAVILFVAIAVVAVAQLAVTLFIVVVLLWEPCFRSGADFSVFFVLILLQVIAFLLQCSSLARRTPLLSIGAEAGSRCGGSGRQDPSVIVEGIVIVDDIVSVPLLLTPRRKGCCRFQHLRLYVCALRCSPLSDVMICVYIYI